MIANRTGDMMPRFVLLTHDHPYWHWDLMLESNAVLRTWRLDDEPGTTTHIRATPLPDHRLFYLDYEGAVSNSRGMVQRWDHGEFELLRDDGQALELLLHGERLQGIATLTTDADGVIWFLHNPTNAA